MRGNFIIIGNRKAFKMCYVFYLLCCLKSQATVITRCLLLLTSDNITSVKLCQGTVRAKAQTCVGKWPQGILPVITRSLHWGFFFFLIRLPVFFFFFLDFDMTMLFSFHVFAQFFLCTSSPQSW